MGYDCSIGKLKCRKLRIPRYGSELFTGSLSQEWDRGAMCCNHFTVFDTSRFKSFLNAGARMPWGTAFISVAYI